MFSQPIRSSMVVAARALPVGTIISDQHIKTIEWTGGALPLGYVGNPQDVVGRDVSEPVGHFFGTGHLEPLPLFDGLDERGRLEQRVVCARVEPGDAAAQGLDVQCVAAQVLAIDVGDYQGDYSRLELAAGWAPRIELPEGLASTIEFYRAHASAYGLCHSAT